jgi:hypothetical protein
VACKHLDRGSSLPFRQSEIAGGDKQSAMYIRGNERSGNISRKLGSGIPEGNERSDTSVDLKGSELLEGNERFDT